MDPQRRTASASGRIQKQTPCFYSAPGPCAPASFTLDFASQDPSSFCFSSNVRVESFRSSMKSVGKKTNPSPPSESQSQSPPLLEATAQHKTVLHLRKAFSVVPLFLFLQGLGQCLPTSPAGLEVLLFTAAAPCRWAPCCLAAEDGSCGWFWGAPSAPRCVSLSQALSRRRLWSGVSWVCPLVFKVRCLQQMC